MRYTNVFIIAFFITALCLPSNVQAQSYQPQSYQSQGEFRQEGNASWYGAEFEGRRTASGEIFYSSQLTAAHPTLPFGTYLLVTNKNNNRQVVVRVNDRGPFVATRIIDVSKAAAEQLDMVYSGIAPVVIETMSTSRLQQHQEPSIYMPPQYTPPPAASAAPSEPQIIYIQPLETAPQAPQQQQPVIIVQQPPQQPAPPPQQPVIIFQQPEPPPPAPQQEPQIIVVQPPEAPPQPAPQQPVIVVQQPEPPPPPQQPNPQVIYITPPPAPQATRLIPPINPQADKMYKLQVGSFAMAQNAVSTYTRLKDAGLNPSYERNGDQYRVVLTGVRGSDVPSVTEKLGAAGFSEALIREEY